MFSINKRKFASFLVGQRLKLGHNQTSFGRLLGIRQQDVSRFEQGRFSTKRAVAQSLVPAMIKVFQISEQDLLEQIGGPDTEAVLAAIKVVLPVFQALIQNSLVSSLTPDDIIFLIEVQESLRQQQVCMTYELASALLSSRKHLTAK